jgi:hypothetical protein
VGVLSETSNATAQMLPSMPAVLMRPLSLLLKLLNTLSLQRLSQPRAYLTSVRVSPAMIDILNLTRTKILDKRRTPSGVECQCAMVQSRVGHPHYPLIQNLLLVPFVPVTRLVLRLLFTILLFVSSWYPAILRRRSLVIPGGAPSTHEGVE